MRLIEYHRRDLTEVCDLRFLTLAIDSIVVIGVVRQVCIFFISQVVVDVEIFFCLFPFLLVAEDQVNPIVDTSGDFL